MPMIGGSNPVELDISGGIGSPSLVTQNNPLPVKISSVTEIQSSGNSSTTQLASGATFTGTIESIASNSVVSILVLSDQPFLITLNQYITATDYEPVVSSNYYIVAGRGFAQSLAIAGNYFNLSVTNRGSTATALLNIQVSYDNTFPVGQAPMALSTPVAIASDQTTIPVATSSAIVNSTTAPSTLTTDVVGGLGPDNKIHTVLTDVNGNIQVTEQTALNNFSDKPSFTTIVGAPDGDNAGVSVFDALVDPATGVQLSAAVQNWPSKAPPVLDAPAPILWLNAGSATGPGPWIDTTGFQSIAFTFNTSSGTFAFQTTNDQSGVTAGTANAAVWQSIGSAAPLTSSASATGNSYIVPVTCRWFRVYCTVAGAAGTVTFYQRAVPMPYLATTPTVSAVITGTAVVNTSQISGTAVVTAGLAGVQAIGGASAIAIAPTTNPVGISGIDTNNLTRRVLTDTIGRLSVNFDTPTTTGQTLPEMMALLIAIGRVQLFYLSEIYRADVVGALNLQIEDPEDLITQFLTLPLPN